MDADAVQRAWHGRTGEYSPDYYAHHGPNATSERLRQQLDAAVGREAAVLELGCSAGRHLAHLYDHGYRDLWGVDINRDAATVMRQAYPALAEAGTFAFDAIEDVITGFDDRQFDAVYSVETLQHIHPDHDWVFEEIARITDELLVTVETEPDDGDTEPSVNYVRGEFPLYRRDWGAVFPPLGFEETASLEVDRDTFRAFRRADAES